MPVRFRLPVPTLIKPPLPSRPPSKVLVVLRPPTVSVVPPPSCTEPLPDKPARLLSTPRLSPAPALMLTPEVLPSAPALSVVTLPETIFTAPVKVLLPASVRSDRPFLIRLPAPLSTPLRLKSLLPATVRSAFSAMALPRPKDALLSSVAAPPTVSAPLPKPLALPRVNVPRLSVVPPLKVLRPLSVRLAVPFLINGPVPLRTPPRVRPLLPPTLKPAFKATLLPRLTAALLSRVAAPPTVRAPTPKAVLLPTVSVPLLSVVPPTNPLAPLSIRLAAPFLIRLPAPLTRPVSDRSALPPTFSAPARLIALLKLTAVLASRLVPAAAFRVPVLSALLEPSTNLPALSAVLPKKVLEPLRIRSAAPFLTTPPSPATKPFRVSALLPPTVNVPPRLTLLPRLTAAPASSVVPLAAFNTPEPNAVLAPTISEPAFSAVAPV